MKQTLTLILVCLLTLHLGAKETRLTNSKYDASRNKFKSTVDTIVSDSDPTLWYLVNRYGMSFKSPDPYTQTKLKDTVVTIWNDNQGEKKFIKNWTNSLMYDSLSRVVRYSYSSCMNCGQIPYTEEIIYNDAGQIVTVNTYINDIIRQPNFDRTMPIRHLEAEYSSDNKLQKLMVYESKVLIQKLEIE